MKIKILTRDLLLEIIMGLLTMILCLFMVGALLIIIILPINNYHHSQGFVEFKTQYKIATQNEGVITQVYLENTSKTKKNSPLIKLMSESKSIEKKALDIHKKYLQKELEVYKKQFITGSISQFSILKKELEIDELDTRMAHYSNNTIYSPIEGYVHFNTLPINLMGSFVNKGDIIGFITPNNQKHIRISFSNIFADRFKMGGKVIFKYKDPNSFKIQKFNGLITKKFIDKKNNQMLLYCELLEQKQRLNLFKYSTKLEAAVLINSTSICQDMFGIDPYPIFSRFVKNNLIYNKLHQLIGKKT